MGVLMKNKVCYTGGSGGSSYDEESLWSGTETASTSGSTINLSKSIRFYDAIEIVCGGNGGSWLIPSLFFTSDLVVNGQYVGLLNGDVGANWFLMSDTSIKVISMSSSTPTTYTKVVGIKFGGGGNAYVNYSTTERAVGTWIDGSTVYERSIDLDSFNVSSGGSHTIESSTNIDLFTDYEGYVLENNISYALPDPSIRIILDSSRNLIFQGVGGSWHVSSGYLTLRYTKSS